jgi:hypothetical protein
MTKNSIRLGAWVLAVPVVCVSEGVLAQTPASNAIPQLWTLIATPLISGVVGIIAAFVAIRFDARKTVNQELIKKRISIYDVVAPKLNDILCFFLSRGAWKSLTPPLMIQRKRELDQAMYVYGHLFTQPVFDQYGVFINICFKTFTGVGRDPYIRANNTRIRNEWGEDWNPPWDAYFIASAEATSNQDVMQEYNKLLSLLATEIGARQRPVHTKPKNNRWWRRVLHKP